MSSCVALQRLVEETLESVKITRVRSRTIPKLEQAGGIRADEMPFMCHLCQTVLEGVLVRLPPDVFWAPLGFCRPV